MKKKELKKTATKKKKTISVKLKEENKLLNTKLETLQDDKLRQIADFENMKKRKNNQISDILKYSGENLIKKIIPVLDDLDRVTKDSNLESSSKDILDVVKVINNKFHKVLKGLGIIKFESINEQFDPELHDAMMTRKSKKKKNTIIEEFEKGYKYHDRIIKHAKVIVSEGKKWEISMKY